MIGRNFSHPLDRRVKQFEHKPQHCCNNSARFYVVKESFSGGFLINIQDKSVTNHNVLCWSFLSSVLLSGVFSGCRIAASKTLHTELARSGSGVRRHCDKYNNHQISREMLSRTQMQMSPICANEAC